MTVQFREDPSAYDPMLGPVLTSARGSAWAIAAAVTMKGLSNDMDPVDVRLWLGSRAIGNAPAGWSGPSRRQQATDANAAAPGSEHHSKWVQQLGNIIESEAGWKQLVRAVRKKGLRSTPLTGDDLRRVRLGYARQLCGWVLTELPSEERLQLKAQVNTRVLLATVGLRAIEDDRGYDSVLLGMDEFATGSGWSFNTGRRARDLLLKLRMLNQSRSGDGRKGRYRMRKLPGEKTAAIRKFRKTIEAVADGEQDKLADVIRSVCHPVWAYSDMLDHRHWYLLLLLIAERDPETFGVLPKVRRELRRTLDAAQLIVAAENGLLERLLDDLAGDLEYGTTVRDGERVSASVAAARAHDAYLGRAELHKTNGRERSETKAAMHGILDALAEAYPLPRTPVGGKRYTIEDRQQEYAEWVSAMHREILSAAPGEEFKERAGAVLVGRLTRKRFSERLARNTVTFIMRAPEGASVNDYISGDSDDEAA